MFYPFYFDYTYIILIPALILVMIAQAKVSGNYNKYSKIANRRGYTGADVARQLLLENGITDVSVEGIRGQLTDHYDPRSKVLRLSEGVYNSRSISALSIAAHETGHALQDYMGYVPLGIRTALVPVVNFSSSAAIPVFIIGLIFGGGFLLDLGLFLFLGAVVVQIITLPVEFNASKRAIRMLENGNYLYPDEIAPAKKVLNAAAMTYVAALFLTISQFLRLLALSGRRRD